MKYKVCWIVLCKNELDILPFVSKYWERIADKVVVYDNGSTDGSLEYLAKLPYVEIRHFDSEGQNDVIQKQVKEQAYLKYKDSYDIIIMSDMDEVFYFYNFKALEGKIIDEGYNCMVTPIYSLCEDFKPQYEEGKLLHQQCHKFYRQKMNHMKGFEKVSKISIFNTRITDKVNMSVGQHFVSTSPSMRIMLSNDGFCLHIDKGLSEDFYVAKRKKMAENLSDTNKKYGMCVEYSKSEEASRKEYRQHQEKSFDINLFI
jgi:hypothetical protein